MVLSDTLYKYTVKQGKNKQIFADFCAFWSPLVPLLAFWLGPKGGKWLCQTSPINRQPILAMCGQFSPTGRFREVKKLIFAVLGAFRSLLEPSGTLLDAFWPSGWVQKVANGCFRHSLQIDSQY